VAISTIISINPIRVVFVCLLYYRAVGEFVSIWQLRRIAGLTTGIPVLVLLLVLVFVLAGGGGGRGRRRLLLDEGVRVELDDVVALEHRVCLAQPQALHILCTGQMAFDLGVYNVCELAYRSALLDQEAVAKHLVGSRFTQPHQPPTIDWRLRRRTFRWKSC